jgi:hypothetical protein
MLTDRFRQEMLVMEALEAHPDAAGIFARLGYRCVEIEKDDWCVVVEKDSLEEAARMHGKPLAELLAALNALPPAPSPAKGPAPSSAEGPAPNARPETPT